MAMAERAARISEVFGGRATLRLLGARCVDCSAGCGGRCDLFSSDDAGTLSIPATGLCDEDVGREVMLRLDDAALRRAAWSGYGLALAGLLLGAVAGAGLGLGFPALQDVLTLAGLLAGTFIAIAIQKPRIPEPQLFAPSTTRPDRS